MDHSSLTPLGNEKIGTSVDPGIPVTVDSLDSTQTEVITDP